MTLAPGSSRRFRLFNACNARYLRLAFEGHRMTLVATDGGLIPEPMAGVEDILLAPGERAEVVVDFRSAAGSVLLNALPYDRGRMSGQNETVAIPVLTINLEGQPTAPITLPARLRTISPLGAPTARKRIEFGERMTNGPSGMDFQGFINGKPFELRRIDLDSRLGEIELWEVANPTDMDHPLHLHGTQFQVVEREQGGQTTPASGLAWKDTVNVARGGIVRFLVRQDMPGLRVYHCHILEHEERGMMGTLNVR
jgi:bilirubin oxidase